MPNVAAVDLGGTKLAVAAIDADGTITRRATAALEGRSGAQVGALIHEQLQPFVEDGTVGAVGIAVPGIYRSATGTVWAPNIPGWEDYPLRDELQRALGRDVACVIESDRSCYILGEVWQGNARGARDAIFIAVGTGIGAGILCDGRIVRGHLDIAGAVGWLALNQPFREEYRGCGNFEYYASGPGIARAAQALGMRDATTALVFDRFRARDAIARNVIEQAIVYWGMAVANLISIFNPEIIVFGGGVFGPAAALLNEIRAEAAKWAQPISMQHVKLVASALGTDAGLYGAAHVALDSL